MITCPSDTFIQNFENCLKSSETIDSSVKRLILLANIIKHPKTTLEHDIEGAVKNLRSQENRVSIRHKNHLGGQK